MGRGEEVGGGTEASWEGAVSIRNDKWISSAPGLSPSTFQCAGAVKILRSDGRSWVLGAKLTWLSPESTRTLSVSEAAEGPREAQTGSEAWS